MKLAKIFLSITVAILLSGCLSGSGETNQPKEGSDEGGDPANPSGDETVGKGSIWPVNMCGPLDAPAQPITHNITNGDAWYQLYQFQGGVDPAPVYASWGMDSRHLEPTHWGINAWVWRDLQHPQHNRADAENGRCYEIGTLPTDISIHIEAGGGRWDGPNKCTIETFSAEDTVEDAGFYVISANQTAHGPYRWGNWPTCPEDGTQFRSESIFRDFPQSAVCMSCIIDMHDLP